MNCPRCQAENDAGARFCEDCGARLEAACPTCGTPVTPGKKFCRSCGAALATEPAGRFASAESYTPKHLAEKILTSKAALEGERKQVTVLFADLKGSMELLADRDPEEARKLLDPVLEHMMEAVHRYEGTVNQVMGDGIMALFGAPLAHEDHAVRACYAALRMQESVKKYAEEVRRSHGVVVKIRVGLNSGDVVVRAIGSDLHMDYTAVGQTTHLAARMEQLAEPGSILLSPATLELAEGYVAVKPLGLLPVKGLPEPMAVYELVGAGAVRSRLHAAAARGLTRFVGRDSEVDQLRQALERAQAGLGQVVAVVGEPGVGKSRLYLEFTHSHHAQGWLLLESDSVSYGKATAYLPVIGLLKAYFHIEGRDETRTIREKATGKVLSLDRALEPSLSALLALLEVPVEDEAWARLDPAERRRRTLDAVKRLLLRESQVQPLLLLVEDLHWIDAETQALLDSLVESLPTARLLLLVNYRPEYQHGWGSKTYYRQLRIDPLPAESAGDFLRSLLGTDTSLDALKRILIDWTEGNPLFLEESVRTLVETKTLMGERAAYRLAQDATAVQVPATVQAILAARIDRLAPEDKRLLQAASVIGKDVPFALLLAVAELSEEDLRHGLARIQAAEFLYEARLFPDLEYTFKHALTHEVAYGSLLQERRRSLHTRIVAAIEALYPDRMTEQVERLAHHAFRGEDWAKAVGYLRHAGSKAAARSAHLEAVECLDQALEALRHLPESHEKLERAIDLRFALRNSLYPLGKIERILTCLHEAETLAAALDDQARLAWVAIHMANHYWVIGENDRAVEVGQAAPAIADSVGDLALQVEARYRLAQVHFSRGDYLRAIDLLRWVITQMEGERRHESLGLAGFRAANAREWLGWCLAERGEFAEGIAQVQEGVRIAEAVADPFSLAGTYLGLGLLYLCKGDLEQAIPLLERSVGICQAWHTQIQWYAVAATLGHAYALSGRFAEALPLLEQAVSTRTRLIYPRMLASLGEAYLLAGRLEDARGAAERGLALARAQTERGHESRALRLLGQIAAHDDPPQVEQAGRFYEQALALAEELEMRPLVAHCHLGLGKLYRRTGQREQARAHLTTATTMYREMDMGFWLEQAEAEMRELG